MRAPTAKPGRKPRRLLWAAGILAVLVIALVALWDWNWFRPLVERQASAAIGRKVTLQHFDLRLGRVTEVIADGVTVANPDGFDPDPPFASIDRLSIKLSVMDYIRTRSIVIPDIAIDHPVVEALAKPDGANNWTIKTGGGSGDSSSASASPQIGQLHISDGHAHAVIPKLKANFGLDIATRDAPADGGGSEIVVDAKGTYAAAPITGHFVGGALLSLRDPAHPYPIDLAVANGPTHVTIKGTVQQPLTFGGANVRLELAGSDMAALYPLTGIAIPQTPPYDIAGMLDYADRKIRFDHFTGRLGSSDIGGDIAVDPTGASGGRPLVIADLASRKIDLADLGGFIGSTPGRAGTPGQTAQQRQSVAKAEASSQLIPDTPINLPKVRAADVRLRYHGDRIEGRSIPLDKLVVALDITDGNITLHPVSFSVGAGAISSDIELTGAGDAVHAKADVNVRRVDLSRLMQSTHVFHGQGVLGGNAHIDATGNSLAAMLGGGNGELRLFMNGGDLSALLIDLSGLEFGNAVLSALGIPNRAKIQCLITDFALTKGIVDTKTMLLSTDEANTYGSGSIDLRKESLDLQLQTRARHFTIGTLPTPINIGGTFKSPTLRPGAELAVRTGAAVGLGLLLPPLALLPTIQLGLGQDDACAKAMKQE